MTEQREKIIVEKIRDNYTAKKKEYSKFEELKLLDKKVKRPALVFGYVFGIFGTLVLGLGMSLVLEILSDFIYIGVVVGIVGAIMVTITYPIYNMILSKRKVKYSEIIIEKSNEILND